MRSPRRLIGEFQRNYRDPDFWREAPEFLWRHVLTKPLRKLGWLRQHAGTDHHFRVTDADWDNCIILDACRYDVFSEAVDDWPVQPRISDASDTGAYLAANYPPSVEKPDLVYINANPRVAAEPTGDFHAIEHVWASEWSEADGTVRPEAVRDAALDATEQYPNKRLLVHFVQPHIPYIGETADQLPGGASIQGMRPDSDVDGAKPFRAVTEGTVSPETVHDAYRESLDIALDVVRDLVDEFPGKTVVTADHGDLLGETDARVVGEFSQWGHPADTPVPPLVKVPWAVPAFDERKPTHEGTSTDTNRVDPDNQQLRALGYT